MNEVKLAIKADDSQPPCTQTNRVDHVKQIIEEEAKQATIVLLATEEMAKALYSMLPEYEWEYSEDVIDGVILIQALTEEKTEGEDTIRVFHTAHIVDMRRKTWFETYLEGFASKGEKK